MKNGETPTIVYAGPSIQGFESLATNMELRPPVRRGDLDLLQENFSPGRVLIIDGLFGANMAVTLTECRQLIENGWLLYGCSSMGALRAAELYSVGMQGLGVVYDMLRLGVVNDDAELAVAYHPESYQEISISIIHIRAVLMQMLDNTLCSQKIGRLLQAAKQIFYLERTTSSLEHVWYEMGISQHCIDSIIDLLDNPTRHPKRNDAKYALQIMNSIWPSL